MDVTTRDELDHQPLHPYTPALVAAVPNPNPDPTLERPRTPSSSPASSQPGQSAQMTDGGRGPPAACHFAEPLAVLS